MTATDGDGEPPDDPDGGRDGGGDDLHADDVDGEITFPLTILRVVRTERTRVDVNADLMGRGVQLPSGCIVMEWYRPAYPVDDRLTHPHQSVYWSQEDLEQGTGGEAIVEEVIPYE